MLIELAYFFLSKLFYTGKVARKKYTVPVRRCKQYISIKIGGLLDFDNCLIVKSYHGPVAYTVPVVNRAAECA
jgi:hypothetical protein